MIFNAFGENFSQYKSSKMKKKPPIHAGIALFYNPRVKLRKKIGGQGPITVERNALPDMPRSKTP